ncbi:MAG: O-antigen ligase family protein [Rhizobiaceae bacterium]|nr:O-antigen ligase family protein [Rhizobiaceae bacterium]
MTAGVSTQAHHGKLIALAAAASIFLGVGLSGFVLDEPAPYEIYMATLMAVWFAFGLAISRTVAVLLCFVTVFNIGGALAILQMAHPDDAPLYIAVSLFLGLTSVFFAAAIERQPNLYATVFQAWITAALLTAFLAIVGYFGLLPGGEIFTRYGRASGAFQDPNVFGPFLVAPATLLLYRLYTAPMTRFVVYFPMFLVLLAGIFLSFSRGAWGLFLLSALLLTIIMLGQRTRGATKLRIAILCILAVAGAALALLAILQLPGVGELFSARAHLAQDYDSGRFGRFGRYSFGFDMAMQNPFGIGPLVFGKVLGEDTHNIWLKALLDYGWIGFASYVMLIVLTLAGGATLLFRQRPWQPYFICAYVTLFGHVLLGTIIDTDHWRHFYVLVGLVWAAMAIEAKDIRRTAIAHLASRSSLAGR